MARGGGLAGKMIAPYTQEPHARPALRQRFLIQINQLDQRTIYFTSSRLIASKSRISSQSLP
jgi:hypothetical protein